MNDFSIVIQGTAHENSLSNIENYQKFGQVIISDYIENRHILSNVNNSIRCILQNTTGLQPFANFANQGWHSISTYNGLLVCNTEYAIKVRSDEAYTDLQPIIDSVLANPLKWTSHNIWFKKVEKEWLHPGDHLIAGKTSLLREAFRITRDWAFHMGGYPGQWQNHQMWFPNCPQAELYPENIFFLAFLNAKYGTDFQDYITKTDPKDIMRNDSALVNIDKLGSYIWSFVNPHGQREFLNTSELAFNWPGSAAIQSMDEI